MGSQQASDLLDSPVGEEVFRQIMSSFPTGVTVVTGRDEHGCPVGLTANAVTSVSKSPPLILVCIGREKFTLQAIKRTGVFAINFLDADQEDLARRFAVPLAQKFSGIDVIKGALKVPILRGNVAHAECRVFKIIDAGDHAVVVGSIVTGVASSASPLLYFRGQFYPVGRLDERVGAN